MGKLSIAEIERGRLAHLGRSLDAIFGGLRSDAEIEAIAADAQRILEARQLTVERDEAEAERFRIECERDARGDDDGD